MNVTKGFAVGLVAIGALYWLSDNRTEVLAVAAVVLLLMISTLLGAIWEAVFEMRRDLKALRRDAREEKP